MSGDRSSPPPRGKRAAGAGQVDPFGWVGAVLDCHFAVEAVAGDGGFGIVYRGRHLGLDAPIAIKLLKLPPDIGEAEQAQFLARLRREARFMHRLSRQTPGIVQALHVGAAVSPNGRWAPYLVMEWAEGDTLDRHLSAQRRAGATPPGLAAAAQLLASAADAIAAMHRENVAHLDIKPANLVFARAGAGRALKVLDFGVARTFAADLRLKASTTTPAAHLRAFTPQYGTPEQFSKQYGALGPWTDVFAMALVLIEVASGRRALQGENVMQLYVAAIADDLRVRLPERVPGASEAATAVLRRALEVSPELRFRTMDAFWAALLEALAAEGDATTLPTEGLPWETANPEAGDTDLTDARSSDDMTEEPLSSTILDPEPSTGPYALHPPSAQEPLAPTPPKRRRVIVSAALPLLIAMTATPVDAPPRPALLRAVLPDEAPIPAAHVEPAPHPLLDRASATPKVPPLPVQNTGPEQTGAPATSSSGSILGPRKPKTPGSGSPSAKPPPSWEPPPTPSLHGIIIAPYPD